MTTEFNTNNDSRKLRKAKYFHDALQGKAVGLCDFARIDSDNSSRFNRFMKIGQLNTGSDYRMVNLFRRH